MTQFGYLIWIFFSSWGSVWTLPHVVKYQIVTPQKLKYSSHIISDDATYQTYPDVLEYSLRIAGQNCTLHLERNKELIGRTFSVTHFSERGVQLTTKPALENHCYYHGHIVGVEDSSASVELCSGIKGFVRLQDQTYLIEPLASATGEQQADGGGAKVYSDKGPHAVYNYKHLRRKRSSCSHGNITMYYDHGARPSGLFQLSSLRSRAQTKDKERKPRTVELAIVVDYTEYKKFGSNKIVEARVLEIANHVDRLYRPVGIRVMLVGLDIWSYKDQIEVSTNPEQTLSRFLEWRQRSLLPRTKHDNAQFITGVDFEGTTVGLANTNAMCTSTSGAVNEDHNNNAIGVSSTIAHEMGHNLGLSHDTENCICGSLTSKKGCIMAESVGVVYPELFSSCSQQQLSRFLEEVNPACLLDTPPTNRIYGGPVCGNAFLEPGEECDCGTVEECKNPCCNATNCKLNTGAQCAEGECCHDCQLKASGSVCRPKTGNCDLAEYCTGLSASCPLDAYVQNGLPCNRGKGYCYNGKCPSRQQHCKRLWGPDAEVAADACFFQHGGCRKTFFSQRCLGKDQSCRTLFCSGGWEFPVTSRKSFYKVGNEQCNEATMNPDDNYPADFGMVPTGTKCGNNMVCYNQRCQDIRSIRTFGTNDCSAKCNNRGVCNHESKCHCDPGWAPPFCDVMESDLPGGGGLVLIVSLVVGLLILLVVLIGGFVCFTRTRQPPKRCLQSTSGQTNPLFHTGNARGSPHLRSATISQPTFVESSASRICKPLSRTADRPSRTVFKHCRTAPEPPRTVPQPSKIQQGLRPLLQPPAVPSKPVYSEARPLPPSRPLPPLASKPVTKPKPLTPPVKPKPAVVPVPLPHTQLLAGRAALIPHNRPR
ncbi:disintegrin and metalloproteinase domain-containing protein 8a [Nerophis lumbriciformis]|uniref:disintegrin and metalloproteinase domain-containing protein 8a n=1 Tax=Nerophis lumbriciformis TaxID=546530 RepID=UPI002AE08330|nr:disintegrin and metalloproteinase domain-containing protein 8a [Nerophis lumbriciformis]XP_061808739.1 disintegrin and metalloproteinase domain-containing protein 8a [Nerophis lumbriciformis]